MKTKIRLMLLLGFLILTGCTAQTTVPPVPSSTIGDTKSAKDGQAKAKPMIRPAQKPKWVATKGEPSQGSAQAPLTMVGFSDFECRFCAIFATQILPQLEREFIQTGQVNYVFRDVPVEKNHPQALPAAVAAQCAREQKKFWPMHNLLFSSAARLQPDDLLRHAQTLGFNESKFQRCLNNIAIEQSIRQDIAAATELGVKVTPTFFLGYTPKSGEKMEVKVMLAGSQPYELYKKVITDLLKQINGINKTKP
jgi:protein-disulfide isomerase